MNPDDTLPPPSADDTIPPNLASTLPAPPEEDAPGFELRPATFLPTFDLSSEDLEECD